MSGEIHNSKGIDAVNNFLKKVGIDEKIKTEDAVSIYDNVEKNEDGNVSVKDYGLSLAQFYDADINIDDIKEEYINELAATSEYDGTSGTISPRDISNLEVPDGFKADSRIMWDENGSLYAVVEPWSLDSSVNGGLYSIINNCYDFDVLGVSDKNSAVKKLLNEICAINNIANPNIVSDGQKIFLPNPYQALGLSNTANESASLNTQVAADSIIEISEPFDPEKFAPDEITVNKNNHTNGGNYDNGSEDEGREYNIPSKAPEMPEKPEETVVLKYAPPNIEEEKSEENTDDKNPEMPEKPEETVVLKYAPPNIEEEKDKEDKPTLEVQEEPGVQKYAPPDTGFIEDEGEEISPGETENESSTEQTEETVPSEEVTPNETEKENTKEESTQDETSEETVPSEDITSGTTDGVEEQEGSEVQEENDDASDNEEETELEDNP